nr:uncharacterized protein LOC100181251 [Ciona intestinalis]|eukprot:XP_002123604.2 uncharacterized protein LOC100181251 [Ciona intestinalis]
MKIKGKSAKTVKAKSKAPKEKSKSKAVKVKTKKDKKVRKSRKPKQKSETKARSRSNSRDSSRNSRNNSSRRKKKKTKKKVKKEKKKQSDDVIIDQPRRNSSLGSRESGRIAKPERPWYKKKRSKKDPIVYSCCGFCSLGAGSLLTGLIYIGLCIGYTVLRVSDFRQTSGRKSTIWSSSDGIFMNIWRIMLIVGMGSAALNMLGALVIMIASCIWGQKEHYIKMRNSSIIWMVVTAIAIIFNVGEAVYVTIIPWKELNPHDSNPYSPTNYHHYSKIKNNMATLWGLTGCHIVFYIYLIIVVISYLRLLKYKGAPKVGVDPTGSDEEVVGVLKRSSQQSSFNERRSQRSNMSQQSEQASSYASSADLYRSTYGNPAFIPDNTYENWPKKDDAAKSDVTVVEMPSRAVADEAKSATSSIYDLPPEEQYDDTPVEPKKEENKSKEKPKPETKVEQKPPSVSKTLDIESNSLKRQEAKIKSSTVTSSVTSTLPPILKKSTLPRHSNSFESKTRPIKPMTRRPPVKQPPKKAEPVKPDIQPEVVSKFFKRLESERSHPNGGNPMEEMFRLFGGSLCDQHPENCERYLKSYKDVRSRTSHISSVRDPFEYEVNPPPPVAQQPQPQQFPLLADDIYTDHSMYGGYNDHSLHHNDRFYRHQFHNFNRPEPVNGFRPQSRVTGYRPPPKPLMREPPRNYYPEPPPPYPMHHYPYSTHSNNYYDDSIYYDSECSMCEYGSIYGDYGSYYGSYGEFYPPNPPSHSLPPNYPTPTPHTLPPNYPKHPPYTPSRRTSGTSITPTWFPLQEDDYSIYPSPPPTFKRSKSLPNIQDPLKMRPPSYLSEDRAPVSPAFVVPSPREATRVSRSSSFADDHLPEVIQDERRVSNYSGYHTGDLRNRTSHTADGSRSFKRERTKSFSETSRRASFNIGDDASNYEELGSIYSTFNLISSPGGRPPMRPKSSASQRLSSDFPSRNPRLPPRSPVIPPRVPSFGGHDPYPDKHISKERPSSILRSSESSLDGTKALVPYKGKSPNHFQRSKSFRFSDQHSDKELKTKQVKFGSTPNLHHI